MSYSYEALVEHPALLAAVRNLARTLRQEFSKNPWIGRLLSAHQKWLLTQIGMALNLDNGPDGFTATELRAFITPNGVASRNTVQSFLDHLETYRYIERIKKPAATRPKRYRAMPISEQAMFGWYVVNLQALDGMDGGMRAQTLLASPHLFRIAQPLAARAAIADRQWVEPPRRVGLFLWTEAGALVMDEFISRIDDADRQRERIEIGYVDARKLASEFMMSRTHLQRLLNKAAAEGAMGWMDESLRSGMWFSGAFLDEYCRWQARKFCFVNDAFHVALAREESGP